MNDDARVGAVKELRRIANDIEVGGLNVTEWAYRQELIALLSSGAVQEYRNGPRRFLSITLEEKGVAPVDVGAGEVMSVVYDDA